MHLDTEINISDPDRKLLAALQSKIDDKTKPLGALGKLEELAVKIGLVQQTLTPQLHKPVILVFAGDHGVTEEGVSPYPQQVTHQMVLNFLAEGAAINVFARQHGIQLRIIDAGVNADFDRQSGLIDAKIAKGTANFLRQAAMSREQCLLAISRGRELAWSEIAAGSNVLGFGEMGIGNTSAAAAIMSALCHIDIAECVGRGTGLDDNGLRHKQEIIAQALALHQISDANPLQVLSSFGGFEIAMMVGAMLGAAEQNAILLIDGFIATTALLVAVRLQPNILSYSVFSHRSGEIGHALLLKHLQVEALLDLGMRLGEGTGAAMAYPLLQAAVNFLNQMASFSSAGVSHRQD